jgi:hypothetical protein
VAYENDVAQMTWTNQKPTRVKVIGGYDATWPNHRLPRGTPGLANEGYVKIFWGPGDSNPGPPPPATT